ncbi:MAG TPA: radical SAM protein [Leptospiraceae bacterium]|nr:radical SAM protein [Leptospiraceae bacterium]HMX57415.1 radical SAM protein [Leptospiraceae bacterium]HNN60015.1 radical SAM protein [Leptospiraceae bacterium]HNN74877.1 radical SAM protein [Leptospiraceae bacterium]
MLSIETTSRLTELQRLEREYRQIPFEAILKQDVLRLGLAFEESSLKGASFKAKDYFIFTFDHVPLSEQDAGIRFKVPEEIRVEGGPFQLLPTVISVRVSPDSPYIVKGTPEGPALFLGEERIGSVGFPPVPAWYDRKTASGKLPGEVAPVIEWGYLIYLTAFRNCQYFGKDEECAYCDINHNYRQQKGEGRPYTGVKDVSDILEVLSWIAETDTNRIAKAYTITGGSVTTQLRGKGEVDFYLEYASAIESKFPGRWIGKIVTQAWEKEEVRKFKDAGIRIYHPNYEVWDPELFKKICPGKERTIGRDTWIRRILESTEVMGPENVIPNFVGGVELAKPYGFSTVDEAIQSTAEGLDFFMSHGVAPRFTTWCPEPFTTLSTLSDQTPPPLEYFCKLLTVWKETHEKYKLPVPPGYGDPGPGRAVFSVSAFMDIIGYEGRN